MKKLILLILPLLLSHCIYAQHTVTKRWDARFGGIGFDGIFCVVQAKDGGYILGGESASGISGNKTQPCQGGSDYWIVKINIDGNYQWDKRYGGTNADIFGSISLTMDGGYILGGSTISDSSADKTQPSRGGWDYWVVKIDSLGNKQWDKRFGGSNDDFLDNIVSTRDGGYIIAGDSHSGISGDKTQANWDLNQNTEDYWIVKIDNYGTKQWDKRFGGNLEDGGCSVIQTPDGGYLIGGTSVSDSSGDKTQPNFAQLTDNFWVIKIDSLGNKEWDKVYGGTYGEYYGNALNTSNGNYMLGGTSFSAISGDKTEPNCGYWLVKIDTLGNKLGDWAYGSSTTAGGGGCEQYFGSMSKTNDGGYLMTGTSGRVTGNDKTENNLSEVQVWTIKIDSQMHRVWDKTSLTLYNTVNPDQSAGAIQGGNSCYVIGVRTIAGIGGDKTHTNWDTSSLTQDYWIVEYCDTLLTGITETAGDVHFSIYPNPTSREVSIMLQKDNLKEATFTLTNTSGQLIYQSDETNLASTYTKILDLGNLPTGIYLLDVVVDGQRIVRKVMKE